MLNDLAILKLANPVQLNDDVQIACLPRSNSGLYPQSTNIPIFAVGWGAIYEEGPTSDTLQNVRMTLYDGKYCQSAMASTPKDWAAQICVIIYIYNSKFVNRIETYLNRFVLKAGEYFGGKDTCQGDSGGAIYTYGGQNKYIAIGIGNFKCS
jgi:hypothetical protein